MSSTTATDFLDSPALPNQPIGPVSASSQIPACAVDFGSFTGYFAAHKLQGNRAEQQDEVLILAPLTESSSSSSSPDVVPLAFLAVMDGHGSEGGKASRALRASLQRLAPVHVGAAVDDAVAVAGCGSSAGLDPPILAKAIQEALVTLAAAAQAELTSNADVDVYLSGSTLVMAVVTPKHIVTANVGDSRAVYGYATPDGSGDSETVALTVDHTCGNEPELARVLSRGARVERSRGPDGVADQDGPLRLYKGSMPYPGLVVTRAMGDTASTAIGVLATPEATAYPFRDLTNQRDAVLCLASDGVWDGVPNSAAAVAVAHKLLARARAERDKPETKGPSWARVVEVVAKKIAKTALAGLDARKLDDNVSCVVCVVVPKTPSTA
ncbi:phosphatase 2C-like domain-containing protein [Blastocladiella britannica]|nr:phosphatase 2C-like domain-containing protein [Blastocladiella britannica]